ncbi:hypothetical protein C8F04DRAFT_1189549 [Mycena alexandri]|uniref:Uncharacterized protein n=1 Tax=Mycena alexandri TaxID=1745969 RepID=A0AAD6SG96_9AGAR|nr:hypothetical protein C8F04DRAFT_1189549 [Mycena alexandri]
MNINVKGRGDAMRSLAHVRAGDTLGQAAKQVERYTSTTLGRATRVNRRQRRRGAGTDAEGFQWAASAACALRTCRTWRWACSLDSRSSLPRGEELTTRRLGVSSADLGFPAGAGTSTQEVDEMPPPPGINLRWSQYTPETASRSRKAPLKQSSIASDIPLDKLKISPAQREQLQQIYESNATATPGNEVSRVDYFYTLSDDDQLAASAIMAQQGLDIGAQERIDNRWSQQWGRASNLSAKAKTKTRRVLYLCRCGYDHTQVQKKERHTPVPFTSCLTHGEITYDEYTHKILRIRGFFHHNAAYAHALQTKTAISRAETSAPSLDRPTVRAAAAVADLLQEHEPTSDDEEDGTPDLENDSDSDIDTDASSDSDDDSGGEEDPRGAAAAGNLAALGEQALARTVYELQEMGPRLGDLAEYMKRKSGPLSTTEQAALSQGRGHLAALLGELDRLLFAVPAPSLTQNPVSTPQATPAPTQTGSRKRKSNRTLEPPSPEKRAQKRHQSYSLPPRLRRALSVIVLCIVPKRRVGRWRADVGRECRAMAEPSRDVLEKAMFHHPPITTSAVDGILDWDACAASILLRVRRVHATSAAGCGFVRGHRTLGVPPSRWNASTLTENARFLDAISPSPDAFSPPAPWCRIFPVVLPARGRVSRVQGDGSCEASRRAWSTTLQGWARGREEEGGCRERSAVAEVALAAASVVRDGPPRSAVALVLSLDVVGTMKGWQDVRDVGSVYVDDCPGTTARATGAAMGRLPSAMCIALGPKEHVIRLSTYGSFGCSGVGEGEQGQVLAVRIPNHQIIFFCVYKPWENVLTKARLKPEARAWLRRLVALALASVSTSPSPVKPSQAQAKPAHHYLGPIRGHINLPLTARIWAKRYSAATPSTNVPIGCELCDIIRPRKTHPAFWKYSFLSHIRSEHPRHWNDVDSEGAPQNLPPDFANKIAIPREELVALGIVMGLADAPSAQSLAPPASRKTKRPLSNVTNADAGPSNPSKRPCSRPLNRP